MKQSNIALLRLGPFSLVVTRISSASYSKAPSQIVTSLHLARLHRARLYLVRPERPLNRAVFDLRASDVRILPEIPWLTARLRRHWGVVLRLGDPHIYSTLDTSGSIAHRPVAVRFLNRAERLATQRARALGITEQSRLVTLHVREGGFKTSIGQSERGKDDIRNCRIETYYDAIDYLVSLGRTVVRIGDPTMTPIDRPGVVDLATSPLRDEWVELWCMMRSEFFIASQSGPYSMAIMTNTPVLMVNVVNPLAAYPHRRNDLYVLKHVLDRKTGRALPLSELLMDEESLHRTGDLDRYAFADNSSVELVDAVREMIECLHSWPPATAFQDEYARSIRRIQVSDRSLAKLARKGFNRAPFQREGRIAAFFAERYMYSTGQATAHAEQPA